MNDIPITSLTGIKLLNRLPVLYSELLESRTIAQSEGAEFDSLYIDVTGLEDQYIVESATWGLSQWEAEFGIASPAGQPNDQRRSVIRSRIRGTGTVTIALIKNVAEAFLNGEVSIAEDNPKYQVIITFIGKRGVPPNLDDIKQAINDILPAHLQAIFKYTYLFWDELERAALSWNQADTYTWDQLEEAFLS